jgi:hypothetical protein
MYENFTGFNPSPTMKSIFSNIKHLQIVRKGICTCQSVYLYEKNYMREIKIYIWGIVRDINIKNNNNTMEINSSLDHLSVHDAMLPLCLKWLDVRKNICHNIANLL